MAHQPIWKCIANLGDVHPLDYGGYFVFVDETGVYVPEAELLLEPCDDDDDTKTYTVYRFSLDPCTFVDGILSDNKFHPGLSAWFAQSDAERAERPQDTTNLANVAESIGGSAEELIMQFCSADPIDRARAYRAIGEYHGFVNLDSYPLQLTRTEAHLRYKAIDV